MSFKRKNKSNLILVLPVLVLTIIFSLTYSYGAEILKGVEEVKAFGGYKVNSEVQVSEGKISHIEIYGSDFAGSHAETNKAYMERAVKGMKDKFIGKSATDIRGIKGIDNVARATISSDAIKKSVMNALKLEEQEEPEYLPDKVPAPGDYTIQIRDVIERIEVKNAGGGIQHSLLGTKTAKALLHVDKNRKMSISYLLKSGTVDEPLYILSYNGFYDEDLDNLKEPSLEGVEVQNIFWEKSSLKKYAELKGISDKVVGRVTRPLKELKAHYYDNVKLYVPAMKDVNKPGFDNGKFTAVSKLTPDWKTLKKVKELKLANGSYTVKGSLLQPDGVTPSMADGALQKKITLDVKNGKYYAVLNFDKMKKGSVEGYLGSVKYYASGYIIDEGAIHGELRNTDILSYHTDKKGKRIKDEYGTDYPKTVRFQVIPEAKLDGTAPLQLTIPAMESFGEGAGTKDVLLKLDWSSVKKKPEKEKPIKKFKVKSNKKKVVTLSWQKVSNASGYTVYMAKSKKGKFKAVKNIGNAGKNKCILKKLKSKKKLYFMVKAFKKQKGKKVYIAKSKVISVKVK